MTNNKESKKDDDKVSFSAEVVADQAGSDSDTGELLYQVELRLIPRDSLVSGTVVLELSRDEYKSLKEDQLSGSDDLVKVYL